MIIFEPGDIVIIKKDIIAYPDIDDDPNCIGREVKKNTPGLVLNQCGDYVGLDYKVLVGNKKYVIGDWLLELVRRA